MRNNVIWAAKRLLTRRRFSQEEERRNAEFKARVVRIDAFCAKAAREWEAFFEAGADKNADPAAQAFHADVTEMMDELQKARLHPEHDRAAKEAADLFQKVRRMEKAEGLPARQRGDLASDPPGPASPELVTARCALREASAKSERAALLPKPTVRAEDLKTAVYEMRCWFGWAAYVLPPGEFEYAFLDLWTRFGPGQPQVKDARRAFESARRLRNFPRLEAALERWPELPFSYEEPSAEDLLRARWQAAEPLVRDGDPPEKIAAVFERFTADDLHEVSHGQDLYSAPFILAITRHPLCDWGSALEILHSFSASAYQEYWRQGQAESDFDDLERMLFEAFDTIACRANGVGFRSRSFKTNYRIGPVMQDGHPNPNHPQNWEKWAIPERNLPTVAGQRHNPRVYFDGTLIRPSFEAWKDVAAGA